MNVSPVANGNHEDKKHVVSDLVDNPVVSGANPPLAVTSDQLLGPTRSRLFHQQFNRCLDSTARIGV